MGARFPSRWDLFVSHLHRRPTFAPRVSKRGSKSTKRIRKEGAQGRAPMYTWRMPALKEVRRRYREINALNKAVALLSWDMQVLMPKGGASARAEHISRLSRMAHQKLVSDEMQRAVEEAIKEVRADTDDAATVRAVRRLLDVNLKLPTKLVELKSLTSSAAYDTWRVARAESDFKRLAPYLETLFDIARQTAELLGYREHIYDPLIDLFEEGATQADARAMYESIKGPIKEIVDSVEPVDDAFLRGGWDSAALRQFAQGMADTIGFAFDRGRLDITTNAFCTNFSCNDVRMTTRPSDHINGILFSSLHEMGHGLYEQNSPAAWDGSPLAGGISNGVHESQSRTWENIVGRSRSFWSFFYPQLQIAFPRLHGHSLDAFYRGINKVSPGPTRIGSDELTYNLHTLVRFELECDILVGAVRIRDLPEAWNEKMRTYLNVTPKNDSEGCLQDVHWSRGSVGYFPTYSMGNMISWQIWHTMLGEIPNADELMANGQFKAILGWLTERVYSHGKRHKPRDLVLKVTGRPMETSDFLQGMRAKYAA